MLEHLRRTQSVNRVCTQVSPRAIVKSSRGEGGAVIEPPRRDNLRSYARVDQKKGLDDGKIDEDRGCNPCALIARRDALHNRN